ncbi:MAG: hypothetical protein H7138_21960 [Myxococcales bacterium]|nr:hypothetical protein [Myxococcales bacterium]
MGKLRTPPEQVNRLVALLPEPEANLAAQLRARDLHVGAYCIVGGAKNLKRDRSLAHFTRDDDAWFDFTITVREQAGQLELLAYDFEIRFPPGRGVPFVRFDLNLPAHRNEDRELRSHQHPGSDDLQMPAPLMTPTEVLALFVEGLRLATNRDKPRDPTAFEVAWYRDTHAALAC